MTSEGQQGRLVRWVGGVKVWGNNKQDGPWWLVIGKGGETRAPSQGGTQGSGASHQPSSRWRLPVDSSSQVKECGQALRLIANRMGVTVFLIGHVTKTGEVGGWWLVVGGWVIILAS